MINLLTLRSDFFPLLVQVRDICLTSKVSRRPLLVGDDYEPRAPSARLAPMTLFRERIQRLEPATGGTISFRAADLEHDSASHADYFYVGIAEPFDDRLATA